MSVIVIVALKVPVAVGSKTIPGPQTPPGLTSKHVALVTWNALAPEPLSVTLLITNSDDPTFLTVIPCGELAVFTAAVKFNGPAGMIVTDVELLLPMPFKGTVWGDPVALSAKERDAV